jgi:hypothetical protein
VSTPERRRAVRWHNRVIRYLLEAQFEAKDFEHQDDYQFSRYLVSRLWEGWDYRSAFAMYYGRTPEKAIPEWEKARKAHGSLKPNGGGEAA